LTKFLKSVKSKLEGPACVLRRQRKIGYRFFRPWPFFAGLLFYYFIIGFARKPVKTLREISSRHGKKFEIISLSNIKKPCQGLKVWKTLL